MSRVAVDLFLCNSRFINARAGRQSVFCVRRWRWVPLASGQWYVGPGSFHPAACFLGRLPAGIPTGSHESGPLLSRWNRRGESPALVSSRGTPNRHLPRRPPCVCCLFAPSRLRLHITFLPSVGLARSDHDRDHRVGSTPLMRSDWEDSCVPPIFQAGTATCFPSSTGFPFVVSSFRPRFWDAGKGFNSQLEPKLRIPASSGHPRPHPSFKKTPMPGQPSATKHGTNHT